MLTQGAITCQCVLALLHYEGTAVEADYGTAVSLMKRAAASECSEAMFELARWLLNGRATARDGYAAVALLDQVARSGKRWSQEAQYLLGMCYRYGDGVPVDKEKALYWLTQAVDAGDVAADLEIALGFDNSGNLVDLAISYAAACAAEQLKDAKAMYALGLCFLIGRCSERNHDEAMERFHAAAELGYAPAQRRAAQFMKWDKEKKGAYEQLLLEAANQGYRPAMVDLAEYYCHRAYGSHAPYAGERHLRKALDAGSLWAQCLKTDVKAYADDYEAEIRGTQEVPNMNLRMDMPRSW